MKGEIIGSHHGNHGKIMEIPWFYAMVSWRISLEKHPKLRSTRLWDWIRGWHAAA
jgi:hypothetical protein